MMIQRSSTEQLPVVDALRMRQRQCSSSQQRQLWTRSSASHRATVQSSTDCGWELQMEVTAQGVVFAVKAVVHKDDRYSSKL